MAGHQLVLFIIVVIIDAYSSGLACKCPITIHPTAQVVTRMGPKMKHVIGRHGWWVIHAVRVIVAGVTTLAVVTALGLTVELSAVISAIAVTQSNIGGSLGKAFEQGVGSFLGAIVAAIAALALRPDDLISTALTLALALAPLAVLSAFSIGFLIAPITAVVVLLGDRGSTSSRTCWQQSVCLVWPWAAASGS